MVVEADQFRWNLNGSSKYRVPAEHHSTYDQSPTLIAHPTDSPDLAERMEAFVGRFGRLQDTVGDKLLLVLIAAVQKMAAEIEQRGWV